MSAELYDLRVKISAEAHCALIADLGERGREILERALLGEVHAAKVQVERFTRAAKLVTQGKNGGKESAE